MRRASEYVLVAVAIGCLSWYGWRMFEIRRAQQEATTEIRRMLADVTVPPEMPADGLIGELTIPRLHLSAPVKTGDDDGVLDFSVGYLPDTPLPWMPGNSAFAAHRDRLFRPLANIREGDAITLSTIRGLLNYRVLKTLVVNPQDVWVLRPLPGVSLTLITCYPFSYIGNAPQRFVVHARPLT
jgi:sortase A